MNEMEKNIRFEIKIKNKKLYDLIYGNYGSVSNFSKHIEPTQTSIGLYLNFKVDPYDKNFKLKEVPQKICDHFFMFAEDLFPKKFSKIHKNKIVKEISFEEIPYYKRIEIPYNNINEVEENFFNKEKRKLLKSQINNILSTIPQREQKVIRLRCGLEDGTCHTFEEIAKLFNCTRERVRQIEAKALRRLRHPTRSKLLREYL